MNKLDMRIIEKTLDNGMHVILVHRPNYNRSLFMLSTQAGGFDIEQWVGQEKVTHSSGCAHFLEHQMFRLDGVDVTDTFATYSSQTNAFTSFTKTAYYFQTTSDVKKPLALLMDFVQTLDIDTQSVEKEKGIILSEYDMYQQAPEHRILQNIWQAMYHTHPIQVDILGSREDISNMRVDQLQRFYDLNYDSSRLTLVGVTGKDPEEIMDFIEKKQASISSLYPERVKTVFGKENPDVYKKESADTMDISTPYVCVGFKCEGIKDVYECIRTDVAIQMRLDSLFTPMNPDYQSWLENHIITPTLAAECDFSSDHGYILFFSQTEKPKEFVELVDALIKRLKEPMDKETFEALHNRLVAQNIRALDNFENLAVDLIEAHQRGFDLMKSLELTKELKLEDVTNICQQLDLSHQSVSTIYPKESK